jgi:hypothetical protein
MGRQPLRLNPTDTGSGCGLQLHQCELSQLLEQAMELGRGLGSRLLGALLGTPASLDDGIQARKPAGIPEVAIALLRHIVELEILRHGSTRYHIVHQLP